MFGSKLNKYSEETAYLHLNCKAQKVDRKDNGEVIQGANTLKMDALLSKFNKAASKNVVFFGRYMVTRNNWESLDVYLPLREVTKLAEKKKTSALIDELMDKSLITDVRVLRGLEGHVHGELVNIPKKVSVLRFARFQAKTDNGTRLMWPEGVIPTVEQLKSKKG